MYVCACVHVYPCVHKLVYIYKNNWISVWLPFRANLEQALYQCIAHSHYATIFKLGTLWALGYYIKEIESYLQSYPPLPCWRWCRMSNFGDLRRNLSDPNRTSNLMPGVQENKHMTSVAHLRYYNDRWDKNANRIEYLSVTTISLSHRGYLGDGLNQHMIAP